MYLPNYCSILKKYIKHGMKCEYNRYCLFLYRLIRYPIFVQYLYSKNLDTLKNVKYQVGTHNIIQTKGKTLGKTPTK